MPPERPALQPRPIPPGAGGIREQTEQRVPPADRRQARSGWDAHRRLTGETVVRRARQHLLEQGKPPQNRVIQKCRGRAVYHAGIKHDLGVETDLGGEALNFRVDQHILRHVGTLPGHPRHRRSVEECAARGLVQIESYPIRPEHAVELPESTQVGSEMVGGSEAKYQVERFIWYRNLIAAAGLRALHPSIEYPLPLRERRKSIPADVADPDARAGKLL